MNKELEQKIWWAYLTEDLRELIKESALLLDRVGKWDEKFHDYAFIVFPAAKAYEGYLKKLFLDLGFISEESFYGKRFRIGKALNPSLDRRYRKEEGVYDKVAHYCGGKKLADELWDTWRECRNILFHWFPNEKNAISYQEAQDKLAMILDSMNSAFKQCNIESNDKS